MGYGCGMGPPGEPEIRLKLDEVWRKVVLALPQLDEDCTNVVVYFKDGRVEYVFEADGFLFLPEKEYKGISCEDIKDIKTAL